MVRFEVRYIMSDYFTYHLQTPQLIKHIMGYSFSPRSRIKIHPIPKDDTMRHTPPWSIDQRSHNRPIVITVNRRNGLLHEISGGCDQGTTRLRSHLHTGPNGLIGSHRTPSGRIPSRRGCAPGSIHRGQGSGRECPWRRCC